MGALHGRPFKTYKPRYVDLSPPDDRLRRSKKFMDHLSDNFERISAASGNAPANAYRLKIARVVKARLGETVSGMLCAERKILSNICPRGPETLAIECT